MCMYSALHVVRSAGFFVIETLVEMRFTLPRPSPNNRRTGYGVKSNLSSKLFFRPSMPDIPMYV